jgi:sugar O-acyltransferase (sialic acid O-acetyltransferase NeuD family)
MRLRVLIVGAGAQGRIVADVLFASEQESGASPIGFIDDRVDAGGAGVRRLPLLGSTAALAAIPHDAIVVAVGDNAARERLSLALEAAGERIVTARHPFTSIGRDAGIGPGCMISAGAVVTAGVQLGRGVLVNTSATIDHDSLVADFAHVAVGATVGGGTVIGARTLVGLGANVMTGRRIGADCVIGAGALVTRDLPDNVVAVGVPARVRGRHR